MLFALYRFIKVARTALILLPYLLVLEAIFYVGVCFATTFDTTFATTFTAAFTIAFTIAFAFTYK